MNIRIILIVVVFLSSALGVSAGSILFTNGPDPSSQDTDRDHQDETSEEALAYPENSPDIPSNDQATADAETPNVPHANQTDTGKPSPQWDSDCGSEISATVPWGAYTGGSVASAEEFRGKIGSDMRFLATFVHWGNENEFPEELATYARENNMTPVIYWEAMDYTYAGPHDPRFSYDTVLRGDWDGYIAEFAQRVKTYNSTVIVVLFEEMNSDWYPWSGMTNGNTPQKAVLAYRHVRDLFREVPNARFGWTINNDSVPNTTNNTRLAYYPGDDYVDYVGVNGFNFGDPWQSFSEVFGPALSELATLNKPIIIFSMASADGVRKAAWIRDTLTVQIPAHPEIAGWIWFNEDKEADWRIWSDPDSLHTFTQSVSRYEE